MKKKVYMIHGYAATPSDHWFQSTKQALQNDDITVSLLEMPDPMHPDLGLWLQYLKENLKDIDANTVIIAHSLGVITTLRYLQSLQSTVRLKGLILVSGFCDALPNLPQLDSFTSEQLDTDSLKEIAEQRVVFVSDNDQIVSPDFTIKLAHKIGAELFTIKNAGHFLADDGYTEFNKLVDVVKAM